MKLYNRGIVNFLKFNCTSYLFANINMCNVGNSNVTFYFKLTRF